MTIREIIERGKGRASAWRIERNSHTAELWHYGTRMLVWSVDQPDDESVLDWSTGWGSVSDQNGMNTAFRALDLPYRYSRDQRGGGPRIDALTRHACGHVTDPSVPACTCVRSLQLITGIGY